MAWLYVPESEGLTSDSSELIQGIEQSVTSRGRRMQRRYWLNAWKKGGWIRLLSGMISPPSMAEDGVDRWILSLPDSPASRTRLREGRKGMLTSDTSGLSSSESCARCDPPWCSSKTSQDSLPGFDLSERNYQEWATSLRLDYSQRVKSGQATRGNGCSSWLTPRNAMAKNENLGAATNRVQRGEYRGNLEEDIASWATPTSRDHKDGDCREANVEVNGLLGRQVLQTPKAGPPSSSDTPNSPRQWPTATVPNEHCVGRLDEWGGKNPWRGTKEGKKKLNPLFVEWLMGFPIGWTDLEPVETQSSRPRWRGLFMPFRGADGTF